MCSRWAECSCPSGTMRSCPTSRPEWASWSPGDWDDDSWLRTGAAVDYFLGKGLVERIAAGLHSPVVFSRPG